MIHLFFKLILLIILLITDCYGRREIDVFTVQNCKFLQQLQSRDQIIVFSGFKTQDLLAFYQCAVANPPSKHLNIQKTPTDKRKTSRTKKCKNLYRTVNGK